MKTLLVVWVTCALQLANAQTGVGAKYGSRDPRTCKSKAEPSSGAPSAEQAKQYFQCDIEGLVGGTLYLLENIQVEVGKGVPLLELDRGNRPADADVNSLVYPIRGTYSKYQCIPQNTYSMLYNIGKNCNVYDSTNGQGKCYRTGFGDWHCGMVDNNAQQKTKQPPPK